MKRVILLILFIFFSITLSFAQKVLINSDSTIQVTLDSTGYTEEHPQDISEDAGLFIYSADGREAVRIYGSFRLLTVWDSKKNFHPYDLTQPTIPTGADDFHYPNSNWTVNMSRLGIDALIGSQKLDDMLIRIEVDWKGDNEKFRIRHLFLRNNNWLIGKSWSSFNNVSYLVQAVDGRFAGGAIGTRPVQLRYYNQTNYWKYQFSLEYSLPSLIQPDTLGVEATNLIPNFATNISYESGIVDIMVAGVLRSNRVQYTNNGSGNENHVGYGGVLAVKLKINNNNRLKSSAGGGVGIGGLLGDFAFVPIDLAYNPSIQGFESVTVYTAYVGLEHDWSSQFTSILGWGITGTEEKAYFTDGSYKNGSKVIGNLFYRPKSKLNHLVVGAEAEYAERRNINTPSNNTTRVSFLIYYDF
jgi:hypothetical protein